MSLGACPKCRRQNDAEVAFCRFCGNAMGAAPEHSDGLQWSWVGFGVLIMFGVTFFAGLIMGLAGLGDSLGVSVIVSLGAFTLGGFIVGSRSPGKTIYEPGVAALIAVLIGMLLQGEFDLLALAIGGVLPFLAAVAGGYLGEKSQGTI